MITFKLTFLIAFSVKQPKETLKKIKEQKGKAGQREILEEPKHIIRTDKVLYTAHIEYELVPNKCKYQVDVVCWGPAAKVFTTDGCHTLKTIYRNDQIWVPICIEHYMPPLSQEEIVILHQHIVEFMVNTDKSKLGNLAKSDKTVVLYMREEDINKNEFVDLFIEDPNIENIVRKRTESLILEKEMREIIMKCVNFPRTNTVSWLYYRKNLDEIIKDIIKTEEIPQKYKKAFSLPCVNNDDKKEVKFKTNKKEKQVKEKKDKKAPKKVSSIILPVQAEIFFTDPDLLIFKTESDSAEIKQFYVLITVRCLLTRAQKMFFNPLIVKIQKISSFPYDTAKEAGIVEIFCKYYISSIANCQTINQPIEKTIYFNESHIYFTNTAPRIKLLEFSQTKKLFIEIYGIKGDKRPACKPTFFGSKSTDKQISEVIRLPGDCESQSEESKVALLAVASYDISSLTQNIWLFKEKGQLHNPSSLICQKPMDSFEKIQFSNHFNINEINLKLETFNSRYLFSEGQLIEEGSTLKVEAYLLCPQAATLVLHQIPNTFKRLFIILFSETLAKKFYKLVVAHNDSVKKDLLTGFLLDNGNHFAFYIEGLSTGYILNIWNEIHLYQYDFAKLFFNTDNAFDKRLYSEFAEDGGIYAIILKIPLSQILSDSRIYITGNTPEPCFKALTKFNLLFNSRTLQAIMQYELFPKPNELISLNIEYGVARRWNILVHDASELRTSVFLPFSAINEAQP